MCSKCGNLIHRFPLKTIKLWCWNLIPNSTDIGHWSVFRLWCFWWQHGVLQPGYNRNLSNHFWANSNAKFKMYQKRKSQDTCDLAGILARLDALKCFDPMQCITQPKGLHVYTVNILLKNTWWELQGQGNWIFEIIKQFNCAMSCAFLYFFIYLYIYTIRYGAPLSLYVCMCGYV